MTIYRMMSGLHTQCGTIEADSLHEAMTRAKASGIPFRWLEYDEPDAEFPRHETLGICTLCREWTTVEDPCCGYPVWEGG